MDIAGIRDLLTQVQTGARVSTAIGEPITVGDRVIIPVAEVLYGGGGGGGGGKAEAQQAEGGGGGGGGGVHVHPLGCWVIGPDGERWVPTIDANRLIVVGGMVLALALASLRVILTRRRR